MTLDGFEGFELTEHLADIGISSTARSRERALEFSCAGLMELMVDPKGVEHRLDHTFFLDDAEPIVILRRVLSEVLFLVSSEGLVFSSFEVSWDEKVRVKCIGEHLDRDRHDLFTEVKAITSSQISFEERDGSWHSFVLVDV